MRFPVASRVRSAALRRRCSIANRTSDCATVRNRGQQKQCQRKAQPPIMLRSEHQGHQRRDDERHRQSCEQVEFIARTVDRSLSVAWHHDVEAWPEHDGVEAIPVARAPFCRPQSISERCWENFRLCGKPMPEHNETAMIAQRSASARTPAKPHSQKPYGPSFATASRKGLGLAERRK
jgi:hypothetical protein